MQGSRNSPVGAPSGATDRLIALLLLLVVGLAAGSPPAYAQTPTPDQLRLLQSLSPDEQRALLEQMGAADGTRSDPPLSTPTTSRPAANDAPALALPARELVLPPRIRGGDTVLLDLKLSDAEGDTRRGGSPEALTTDQLLQRALAANPYRLDKAGRLRIPGLTELIPLAGLTASEATERLTREPALARLSVRVSLLNLDQIGVDALKPFGYDLFENVPTTFAPATDIVDEDLLVFVDQILMIGLGDLAAAAHGQLLGGALVRADADEVGLHAELVERAAEVEVTRREAGETQTPSGVDRDAVGL